jgi:hypothetical protein
MSLAAHSVVHEENEWFGTFLLLKPIPMQVSLCLDGSRILTLPTLRFIVAKVVHLAYSVRQDPVRRDEVFWTNRP